MPRLTLANFVEFAGQHFPSEFAQLARINQYTFKQHSLVDTQAQAVQVDLLHIGRYHFQNTEAPFAWAYATEKGISYHSFEQRYRTIQTVSRCNYGRIYYLDAPFRQIICLDDSQYDHTTIHGHNPDVNVWRDIAETVIYFMFLWTGRLNYVECVNEGEMLASFKIACTNFRQNHRPKSVTPLPPLQLPGLESRYDLESRNIMLNAPQHNNVSQDLSPAMAMHAKVVVAKRSTPDSSRDIKQYNKPDKSRHFAIYMENQYEIQTLKDQLRTKDNKYRTTKIKLKKEKGKRRTAELCNRDRDIQIEITKRENAALKKDLIRISRSRQHYLNKCGKNTSKSKTKAKMVSPQPLREEEDDSEEMVSRKRIRRGVKDK
ncbi:predicted protein [Plenodomus lingam JN3]|uniref:Predicted protein n=1 Tax=Leptosphaeria maculans (strain JN3 / isolate v23.1.3 / race Av1-4-5-6-7-8) TaxID=985895 RepID=E4ZRV2_LEPMJ|nr:predicted protein [Plenodomus lingam JN3]CBX93949.1 predicted protein [Plenodomus lingam JN3]